MKFKRLGDFNLKGRRVLVRQDLNVPLRDGKIASATRIDASLQTIKFAVDSGAKVMIMSHLGRPVEGQRDARLSLLPVAAYLSTVLGNNVKLYTDYLEKPPCLDDGEVALLENVRFNIGESADDRELSAGYARLCDIFVMDAFGTAHRAQASTHGVGLHAPESCAGLLLSAELDALGQALASPKRPMIAIVGGAKVSTKLTVLESLLSVVDQLVPGGGIANTFIAAQGHSVGKSLYEPKLVKQASKLIEIAKKRDADIPVPVDVVVGKSFSAASPAQVKRVEDVGDSDLILDIGPETARVYAQMMQSAGTIVWNGPVGVFEFEQFSGGTRELGNAIASSNAFSIAGGGDTLAAIDRYGLGSGISYISTGGGAFLEYLEGKTLPAVAMLESRA
jgi:phosphoglycerate kinase